MIWIQRREFITLLGGAAAWPIAALGQQPVQPAIGFLNIASPETWETYVAGFRQGLAQTGFIEGADLADRVPLGARPVRSAIRLGGGVGGSQGSSHRG